MGRADVAALREAYTRQDAGSGEHAAVAVLLGFARIAGDERFGRRARRSGVDWVAVLADRTWSPAERFVVATAAGLWSGRRTEVDISRVAFLDEGFYAVWLAMLAARRTGRVPAGW